MSTDIYIYGPAEDDGLERDDLEDALRGLLGPAGRLTGAGSGVGGYNVDLTLAAGENLEVWIARLADLLRQLGAGPGTFFEVYPTGWKPGLPWRRIEVDGEDRWLTEREA